MPERIQRKRTKGWRMESPNGLPVVYVGRQSKWGNPFRVGGYFMMGDPDPKRAHGFMMIWCESDPNYADSRFTKIETASEAVNWYRELTAKHPPNRLEELRGKNLACWCPLVDKEGNPVPCHADVLLEMANTSAHRREDEP